MEKEKRKASTVAAYPLCWPQGRPRTKEPGASRFGKKSWGESGWGVNSLTNGRARDELRRELELLGAEGIVISTNMPTRNDGEFYASAKEPADSGVAVYFKLRGRPMVFACDQWKTVKENAWAIAKTISALRGIERWGSGDMLERAFTGFQALPAPATKKHWREILGFMGAGHVPLHQLKDRRDELAHQHHPDRGGSSERMAEINRAFEEARKELGV